MQKEFLKEAVISVAGKQAEDFIKYIDAKKYTNEFLIAKKLGITINQLRNILYKLSDEGIVSSVRKKDKRKGWYTYFWKIEIFRSLDFLRQILEKKINQMNHQIESREKKFFYVCKRCNIEFNEENALLRDFTCGECGEVFVTKDNTKLLKELKKNLDKQIKEFGFIKEEIVKEKENLEKKRLREIKKEEKLKKKKRASAKTKRKVKGSSKKIDKKEIENKYRYIKKVHKSLIQKSITGKKKMKVKMAKKQLKRKEISKKFKKEIKIKKTKKLIKIKKK